MLYPTIAETRAAAVVLANDASRCLSPLNKEGYYTSDMVRAQLVRLNNNRTVCGPDVELILRALQLPRHPTIKGYFLLPKD